jgi:hypothetical protein
MHRRPRLWTVFLHQPAKPKWSHSCWVPRHQAELCCSFSIEAIRRAGDNSQIPSHASLSHLFPVLSFSRKETTLFSPFAFPQHSLPINQLSVLMGTFHRMRCCLILKLRENQSKPSGFNWLQFALRYLILV